MTKRRPKRRFWSAVDEELLRQAYATNLTTALAKVLGRTPKQVLAKAHDMGLHKTTEHVAELARQRTSTPGHGSHRTRIAPGTTPWNKGVKGVTGTQEACRATQFKPGDVPHTWQPVGTYTVNPDGMLDQKVNDDPGPRHVRWKPVHRLVWEAAHGPVPKGHIVVFKHGRRSTDPALVTLDAVECITQAENMRRNSIHAKNPQLSELMRLRGRVTRAINRQAKQQANEAHPHD
jgi:hypothetical protein